MSNQTLERAVMAALADNRRVHADEITVEAIGDSAIVRGSVASPLQHAEVLRTARGVPGVNRVEDMLHLRRVGIDAGADADTEAAVLAALIADDERTATGIDVDADGDHVTLSGVVNLETDRDRAERVALRVGGVAHVHNDLRVLHVVSADDVAERVTNAIGFDAIVGADRITVKVLDNDVTLTGTVRSPEHRAAALRAAANFPGVLDVHDEITVRAYP
jgi:hyperosmotically inducible periplasmic protein